MCIDHVKQKRRQKAAFTLIELLVVVSIIALLVSILLPSLSRARELAKRAVCVSNAKQLVLAVSLYAADNEEQMPYHCNADPTSNRDPSIDYEPYKTYSLHHATIPPGDLVQGLGRLYHTYAGDNLEIYSCPSMQNRAFAYPKMPKAEPYNPDSAFSLQNNQWIGEEPFRMQNRSCYMYRGGDFDGPKVRPVERRLTLKTSQLRGQRGLVADMWSVAGTAYPIIAHEGGINVGFTDGHASWNMVEDFSICLPDYRYVNLFWDVIDNTMN